jgi:hypothetical protein
VNERLVDAVSCNIERFMDPRALIMQSRRYVGPLLDSAHR